MSRDATSAPPAPASAASAPVRVLVAEDNAVNQLLVKRLFEKMGQPMDLAVTGREAVAMATLRHYDIIFMDCSMPDLDGYQATAELRRLERGGPHRTAIVALTANAMAEDRERCLAAGMDDHLSKPVRADDLAQALRRWTGNQRSSAEVAPLSAG
jgi:two-component system sensor histidine kinase/response regulator